MQSTMKYLNGMAFEASVSGHKVLLDAKPPFGKDTAASPKELLLPAIMGCTAMDVVGLWKKYKQPFTAFEMKSDAELTSDHPKVFKSVQLEYLLTGEGLDTAKILEGVTLSLTKYCGVSAMIWKACPIHYVVKINGQEVGRGSASF